MFAALFIVCVSIAFAKPLLPAGTASAGTASAGTTSADTASADTAPVPAHIKCDQKGDQWRNTTVQVVEHLVKKNVTWVTLQYQTMPGCLYTCIVITDGNNAFMKVYDSFLAECGTNGCVYEGRVCYLTSLHHQIDNDEF